MSQYINLIKNFAVLALSLFIADVNLASDQPQSAVFIEKLNIFKQKAPFPGYLYTPNTKTPKGTILLLHGSEGGHGDFWYQPGQKPTRVGEDAGTAFVARHFASQGYVTYALCYFDCRHHEGYADYPPDELVRINLNDTVHKALAWLKKSELTQGTKVVLWGASRGAELSLLYTYLSSQTDSTLTSPDAVIALSPLEYTAPGFSLSSATAIISGSQANHQPLPSWVYNSTEIWPRLPINLSQSKTPLLVSYFEEDPVWTTGDPSVFLNQFLASGVPVREIGYINFKDHQKAADYIDLFDFSEKTPRLFIEFQGSGHVYPPRGSEANQFRYQITEKFLEAVI